MTDQQPFGARLRAAMDGRGPLCAGIDPHAGLLDAWGLTDSVNGLEKFALAATEALAPEVAAVKPQSAFFERFGSRGIEVLERVIATAREAGALVVLDVKRGDIGSTAQAYADAYLDPRSPIAADAITAAPYLGFGSLAPMIATAREHGTGVFVLALTSNPEAPPFQHARTDGGRSVAGTVLAELAGLNRDVAPMGSFGAVVGATIEDTDEDLAINGPLLVPGHRRAGRHGRRRTTHLRQRARPGAALQLARDPGRRTRRRGPARRGRPFDRRVHRAEDGLMRRHRLAGVALVLAAPRTGRGVRWGQHRRLLRRPPVPPQGDGRDDRVHLSRCPAEPPADAARPVREGARGPHRRVAGLPRGARRTRPGASRTPG